MGVVDTMFCLIRNEITGETFPKNIEYDVDRLIALSKRHDLAHLISDALIRNGIVTEKSSDYKNIKKLKMVAIYRETQINETAKKVADIFQQNKIRYIPLKGSVVRGLYPEPWMRTSADIDVLIKREDFDKATELLFQNDFTTENERTSYDMGFYFGKTHLELHHSRLKRLYQVKNQNRIFLDQHIYLRDLK